MARRADDPPERWSAMILLALLVAPRPVVGGATPIRLLVIGDSLTAGYGLASPQAFPAQLERALAAEGLAVRVSSAGVSGDTTAGERARLARTLGASAQAWNCRSQRFQIPMGGDGAEPGPAGLCGGGRGALLATVGEGRTRAEGHEPRYRLSPATGLAAGRGGDGVARHRHRSRCACRAL